MLLQIVSLYLLCVDVYSSNLCPLVLLTCIVFLRGSLYNTEKLMARNGDHLSSRSCTVNNFEFSATVVDSAQVLTQEFV